MNRMRSLTIAMVMLTALPYRAMAEPSSPARGERMYRACVACHSLEPNRNMTGPSLAEIWSRKAGSLTSFPRYSPALKSSGIIWNDDTLDEWIKDPQHFIPGNTMTFAGMKDRRQRADLLAFLKDATRPEQLSRQPARNSAAEHRTRRCHIDHRAPCAGVLARIPRHCA